MHSLNRVLSWTVVGPLILIASLVSATVPSTDRDHPTPLTSDDIRETSGAKEGEYYYTFIAGPGEVVLTLDVIYEGKVRSGWAKVEAELFDMNAKRLLSARVGAGYRGGSKREIERVNIPSRQRLVMRVLLSSGIERYLIRVEGAVELEQAGHPSKPPSSGHGKLHLEMDDGSVQEIDMSRVRRLIIEP